MKLRAPRLLALLSLGLLWAGPEGRTQIERLDLRQMVERTGEVPFEARATASREETLALVQERARPGDCVLLMGARDPSLPFFARELAAIATPRA